MQGLVAVGSCIESAIIHSGCFPSGSLVKKAVYRFSYHAIKATHSRRGRCTAEIYDHVTIDNLFCRVSLMLADDRVIDHVTLIIKLNLFFSSHKINFDEPIRRLSSDKVSKRLPRHLHVTQHSESIPDIWLFTEC